VVVLGKEEIASLISHICPIALKGCKHLTSNSSWERQARQLEPRENVEAERSKIRKLVDGVSGGP